MIGGLVTGVLALSPPGAASPQVPADWDPSTERQAAGPPGTQYIYRAIFSAHVTHTLKVDWGGSDSVTRTVDAQLSGSIPRITARVNSAGVGGVLGGTGDSVEVTSVSAEGVDRTNDGESVQTCTGSSASATGPATMQVPRSLPLDGRDVEILPYALLSVPATCKNNQGFPPSKATYQYGPMWIGVDGLDQWTGESSMSAQFQESYEKTEGDPEGCPGHIPGQTPTCSYKITGTVRLILLETIPPKPTDPKPTKPKPTKPKPMPATVSPGGTRVGTGVLCPKRCSVIINLTGLKGGPKLTAPRVVRPKPGRTVKVKISIPTKKRALVKKAGGVQVKLTYRLTGGTKFSETRKARL